jgi:polysaccharide biosynthesis protein PslH
MRILWLKSDLLLPLDKGGKLRTWHLMRHLARRHDITYLAFADAATAPAHLAGMREVASRVKTVVRTDPPKRSFAFYADAAKYLTDELPYAVAKYRSAEYAAHVESLLAYHSFDLIVCDFLPPAVNLPRELPCPAVLFTHNVESEIWRRHAETQSNAVSRWLYEAQHRRMLRYEQSALARFDGVLAVSDADRQTFERLYPSVDTSIEVVPTGVDTDYFSSQSSNSESAVPSLVFTGSMDWLPNEDAMTYFCREILPLIRADEPGVRLSIVGRAPTPAVQRLAADSNITVTGRVDDVRPWIEGAAVYVVPLRIGGGTRLKIFEAMAMGKAVVSTTVGAEGLPVGDGRNVLLADEPRTFARHVVRLLRNREERDALGAAARALVVDNFDWSAVAGTLEHALTRWAGRSQRIAAAS